MLAHEVIERAERRVGDTLRDRWVLDRVIGIGGMAAVYEATHRNRNRVAIKLLHPALSIDESTRRRFLREGYVANTIEHPGAVKVLDDDVTEDGGAFLVMELLQGETLEERLVRLGGRTDVQTTLLIADQLLDILAAAHAKGVVHRDIKPDNLFLTDSGELKVLDFGIARLHQGEHTATRHGSFMGTPAFCAPEQARGRWDDVDARTDLFSVGATIFNAVSGAFVHEAETASEQLALAIGTPAPSLRSVAPDAPQELVELVDRALSYNKEQRYQTALEMQAAVRRVMNALPDEPPVLAEASSRGARRTTTVPQTIARISQERPMQLRVLYGIAAALLVGALVVWLSRAGQQDRAAAAGQEEFSTEESGDGVEQAVDATERHSTASPADEGASGETASRKASDDPLDAAQPEPHSTGGKRSEARDAKVNSGDAASALGEQTRAQSPVDRTKPQVDKAAQQPQPAPKPRHDASSTPDDIFSKRY